MAQEITVHQPTPMAEIERMAEYVAKSNLFGIKSKEGAVALMMLAQAEGMHPMIAARDYDIIQGRPSKKAEAMLRDFHRAGGKVEWHQLDDTKADATFSHSQGGSFRCIWDLDRAKKAGLGGKEMWVKWPRQMLRSRCVSEGCKTVWPSASSGLYTPEEIQDFDTPALQTGGMRDVTPPRPERAAPTQAPAETQTADPAPMRFAITDADGDEHLYAKGSEYLIAFQKMFAEDPNKDGFWDTNSPHFQEWHTKLVQKAEREGASAADKKAAAAFTEVSRAVVADLAGRAA